EAERKRLTEVLAAGKLARSDRLRLVVGRVHAGFRMVDAGVAVVGDHELFHREEARTVLPRRSLEARALASFLDLQGGDLGVHPSHGIARYRGMQLLEREQQGNGRPRGRGRPGGAGQAEEHLILEFREGTRVYVPASKIDLVQKYVGGSHTDPELSRFGGTG